jgi:hypothetical protein
MISVIATIITTALILVTRNSRLMISGLIQIIGPVFLGIFLPNLCNDLSGADDYGIIEWFKIYILNHNKNLRLSFSYLYKIEVDGKYLLIRGNRMKKRFQPVGGVYKYYQESKSFLDSINACPDTAMGNTDETDDLRLNIKGKDYFKFWKWFKSMKDREYDPKREFEEELLDSGILPVDKFRKIEYRKVHVHNPGRTYSEYLKTYEVVYADIFELKLSNEQKQVIRDAVNNQPDKVYLASKDEMEIRRSNGEVEADIGNNAIWLLGE